MAVDTRSLIGCRGLSYTIKNKAKEMFLPKFIKDKKNLKLNKEEVQNKIFEFINMEYIKTKNKNISEFENKEDKKTVKDYFRQEFEYGSFTVDLINDLYILFLENKIEFLEKELDKSFRARIYGRTKKDYKKIKEKKELENEG